MNRSKLKTYAPQARRDFIKAVTDRAAFYGLMKDKVEPVVEQGDVAIIAGKPFPRAVTAKRKRLEERIRRQGFEQVMEAMAYTWFNRFVAIRFMELHGYLDHGYRVLSHPEGSAMPEIVEHAEHVDLSGLDREKVVELKLEGTKEAELYRMLLVAQCNALHKAMPFLFERLDDETELLLPKNLLHSDSVIRKLVKAIPEEDWQEVEIIGWLYQFYISEKKDQVIGKVVKSEDIPAATQLFTPNWIVKYMVQNTLGRQWMATYPNSPLKEKMEFYIEPAKQTHEVQEQLKAITPDSLTPEELTLLDPACGSGHILVEAYDLLKTIYQERGYRTKDIPRLILEKNLYGLEIDDRAAQLAAFALMMKARADDRRIFANSARPHVLAIQESKGLKANEITEALNAPILKAKLPPREFLFEEMEEERAPLFSRKKLSITGDIDQADVAQIVNLFEYSKTVGSLIRVPDELAEKLPVIAERVKDVLAHGEMFGQAAARRLSPLVEQTRLLARKFDAVVTNPPYMGNNAMNTRLKSQARMYYKGCASDTFAMFIKRSIGFAANGRHIGLVTPFVWLYISSYERLRSEALRSTVLTSLIQLEYNAFEPACVPVCTFTLQRVFQKAFKGIFIDLSAFKGFENQPTKAMEAITDPACSWRYYASGEDFGCIPRSPIAFTLSEDFLAVFSSDRRLSDEAIIFEGLKTRDNERFVRCWFETSDLGGRWKRYSKGGGFRKWYGNDIFVVDWQDNGQDLKEFRKASGQNFKYFGIPTITYSTLSSSAFATRYINESFFGGGGGGITNFRSQKALYVALGFLNSCVCQATLAILSPTLNFEVGTLGALPLHTLSHKQRQQVIDIVQKCISLAKEDWNSRETSWDFTGSPILSWPSRNIREAVEKIKNVYTQRLERMKNLERENNEVFINAYGLSNDLNADVRDGDITLARFDDREAMQQLMSYAVGCMMGRYSLDKFGHVCTRVPNKGDDLNKLKGFRADEDGILPNTSFNWFSDDVGNRFSEFLATVWPRHELEKNVAYIAETLGLGKNETPQGRIRRYFSEEFYGFHLRMYKGRKSPPSSNLLAVFQWTRKVLPMPCLPSPLQRRHTLQDAHRICHPASRQNFRAHRPTGRRHRRRHLYLSHEETGQGARQTGQATS